MTSSLTPSEARQLEQTLAQWQHWSCDPPLASAPGIDRVLGPGLSNTSVRVASALDGRQFVVRIDGAGTDGLGLNRQLEWRVLNDAAAAGIAPAPRYFNPDLGTLVCDYLPPDVPARPQVADIAALLRRIHALPARRHRLDLCERMVCYERRAERAGAPADEQLALCAGKVRRLLDGLPRDERALCHNDLLAANRLHSGGVLWALDWEYAAMGSPWYDLAVVVHGDDMTGGDGAALLEAYLGRAAGDEERAALAGFGCVYRYLELTWYRALGRAPGDERGLDGRREALLALLGDLD